MMLKAALQFAVLLASMQSATTPLRTGDVARQLSEQDVAAIELVLPSDAKPWLLNGDHAQFTGLEFIHAYLSPTSTNSVLRRGTVVTVMGRTSRFPEWTMRVTRSYAQVAIPGRNFDQIEGDQDINRPFFVMGRFDDDELVRLVQFLRSDPERIKSWPILSVERQSDDSVQVLLRGSAMSGQSLKLRQSGPDWVIVGVGGWFA